ncbi:MRC1 domain-containing protein [Favolaschia claudopus]|uniref:MRC1 domain-containing protein n=1 Tax=Favolaschia claudopus TaxID=2862362 RepID=A0AAW0ECK2_9AGAR
MADTLKRPTRTYGRPKPVVSDEAESSLQPSESTLSSGITTSKSRTPTFLAENPQDTISSRRLPSSDVAGDHGSEDEGSDASGGFQFKWKAQLKAMDESDDDVAAPVRNDASTQPPPPTSDHHSPTVITLQTVSHTVPNSPQDASTLEQGVFGGSLSTLTASSPSQVIDPVESTPPASPQPIGHRRRVARKQLVPLSSDDDSGDEDTKGSARSSRAIPHPIASPKSRSSSTPPTSDDELPAQISLDKSRSKGKGKPPSSRPQVQPLQFSEKPVTAHRKRHSESGPLKSTIKAPTKKDRLETIRDRGRIAGAQRAAVQRSDASKVLSLTGFFGVVGKTTALERTATSEDPISSFSSSPREHRVADVFTDSIDTVLQPPLQGKLQPPEVELPALDESDEEMPNVGELLTKVHEEKTRAELQRDLMARKLQLAAARRPALPENGSEDELEIAGPSKPKAVIADRVLGTKQVQSEGKKRQLALGGIPVAQQRTKHGEPSTLTQEQWKQELAKRVKQSNAEMTKKKEDEWVRRGGQVVSSSSVDENARSEALKAYAQVGQKNAKAREERMQVDFDDEDEDASDKDWTEERGSASPRAQDDSDENEEDADITMVNTEENDEDDEGMGDDAENVAPVHFKNHAPRRARPIVDSDSENDENAPPMLSVLRERMLDEESDMFSPVESTGAALHRGSISSMDERTEDEGDKENNTHLMFDRSEDKENKAVTRHPLGSRPGLGRQGSLFGLEEGMQRSLSMSPGVLEAPSDDENDENRKNDVDERKPFQNLLSEDPFLSEPIVSPALDFAAKLRKSSSSRAQSPDSPGSTLRPSFVQRQNSSKAFSQFSDNESSGFLAAPLQPGFSQLFESSTEPKRPLGLSASFSEKQPGLFGLRAKNVDLGLTQDVELQPAFDVGDRLKRQADAVFEKEQEYLWENANKKIESKKQDLYVNDNGFLTQTRPDVDEPEIYTPSSPVQPDSLEETQPTDYLDPQSALRRPLRTLSLTEPADFEAPSNSPMRRLAKRTRTPSPQSNRSSPSASPLMRPKNAFELLGRKKAPKPKRPLEKSEYVAEEAQESDDDEMMAFGRPQDDGEDEEGDDMDRTLETLVDDKEMDEETVAAARVIEKFKEHEHEDDLANEKLQQAVVQGELRKKRRNRFGIDDSDDEDDEEDSMRARKMRRGLNEPKIAENLNKLAEDPNTVAFYNVYRKDLDFEDDGEFAHLHQTQPEVGEDEEMENDENQRGVISHTDLVQQLREAARQEHIAPEIDMNDVSWLDDGSDGEQTQTKVVARRRQPRNNKSHAEIERLSNWAKQEARSRTGGTGRASARTAITGQNHASKAASSVRAGKPIEAKRPLASKPSVLSALAVQRPSRFE